MLMPKLKPYDYKQAAMVVTNYQNQLKPGTFDHELRQPDWQAHARIDQCLKTQAPRMGQGKRPKEVKSNITDNQSAKMTTSKGTIQGYNGVATVDKKHQIVIDAQAFGEGQEHHTLQPVMESTRDRLRRLDIRKDIFKGRYKPVITADTGFANEANMTYLHQNKVDVLLIFPTISFVPEIRNLIARKRNTASVSSSSSKIEKGR